jgi:hypothetical protein
MLKIGNERSLLKVCWTMCFGKKYTMILQMTKLLIEFYEL